MAITTWRCILSTISFGIKRELNGEYVFGDTEELALAQAEAIGQTRMFGYKFERVEKVSAR